MRTGELENLELRLEDLDMFTNYSLYVRAHTQVLNDIIKVTKIIKTLKIIVKVKIIIIITIIKVTIITIKNKQFKTIKIIRK